MEVKCMPTQFVRGLNPYYNGRYSWSVNQHGACMPMEVLILIIMEDTHGAYHVEHDSYYYHVLILIIMEDTHGVLMITGN